MLGERHGIVVVDMLNDFIGPEAPLRARGGEQIVPRISELLSFARQNGTHVIFLQEAHRKNDADFRTRPVHCVRGTRGSDFIDPLRPDEAKGDYIVQKRRHSGFTYTDLDLYLREERVDTVVVVGVWTNVCVRSTVSEALYHTYNAIVLSDCCAAGNEAMHLATLNDLALFAEVMTADQYMKGWAEREGARLKRSE
jgi:nicotinamidase-related amidase